MVIFHYVRLAYDNRTLLKLDNHNVNFHELVYTLSREVIFNKFIFQGTTRFKIIAQSWSRILLIVLESLENDAYYIVTAYEPSKKYQNLYKKLIK